MKINPIELFNNITVLQEGDIINLSNYLYGLRYIKNAHIFLNTINNKCKHIDTGDILVLPSFKYRKLAEDLNIVVTEEETTMRLFKLKATGLLCEDNFKKFKEIMTNTICDEILVRDEIIICILKDYDNHDKEGKDTTTQS